MSRAANRRKTNCRPARRQVRRRPLLFEPLEGRLLLSGLEEFLNPPDSFPAPSDLNQPGPTQAAAADTQERRELIYLAQSVPTAELPVLDRVDTPLLLLYSRYLQGSTLPVGEQTIYGTPYGDVFSTDGTRPHVQAFVQSAVVARSALAALGMEVTAVTDTPSWQVVAGFLPVDAIDDAAHLAGLGTLQASERGTTEAQGAASNQWETVSYADQLKRVLTSVDGNEANIDGRIEIGVISDSINQVGGGVAASQGTGDLPLGNRVQVLDDGPAGGKDEGRAMAELVYDIGPQFNILFHTARNSAADMAAAFDELRQAGADIITEDWSYFTEPVFQDGQIAAAVDSVYLDHGVLVFGSAGNYNNKSYYATWRDDDGDGFYEFADGDETLRITLANGEKLRIYLQWNQFWGLGTTDIDVQLFSNDLSTLLVDSNDDNNPPLLGVGDFGWGTPLESLTYTNNSGAAASYQLAFRFEDGTAPDGLALQMLAPKDKNFPGGSVFTEAYTQNQPAIPGNHAATNMFTLGAVGYTNPNAIEGFSSRGPQTLFFGAGGMGVPEVREKPDFVAADRVDTTFFGSNDNDGSGFNDFFGTSAASPNAAAVAGLVLDAANRRLSYDELSQIFAETSTGTGASAWDPAFGEGLINALGAGLVARGFPHEEAYVELNPFGDHTVRGDFSSDADTDGYAFALESDGQVAFQVIGGGGGQEPGLILWSSESGSFVDIGYDGYPRIRRELASWELYQAELFEQTTPGPNVDSYRLEIDGPPPQITPIGLDAQGDGAARGAMENRRNADYFRIVAPETAGNELTVTLTPEAALNGVLTLYDADGEELARQDVAAAGQAETIAFASVVKGATYYLRVGAARYASAGGYDLEVAFEMALPAGMTDAEGFAYFHFDGTSHDSQTFSDFSGAADITEDIDVDSFFFAGEVAGDYAVSVTPRSGDVAPLVAVYDAATGELLGSTATASEGTTRQLRLPLAAWHRYIVAVADDDRSGTGDVEIVIQGPETLSTTPIAIGAGGTGNLAGQELRVPEDSDFFSFTAPADADGTLTLTVSPFWIGLDTAAILLDAAGNELAKSYLPGGGEDDVIALGGVTPSTTYYLTVLSKDYADQGSYDVSVQFGLVRGSIRGTKFYDLDQDGVQDELEPGLAGWVIYADRNVNLQFDPGIDPFDETDLGGEYEMADLALGGYRIREVPQAGWAPIAPLGGSHNIDLTLAAPNAAGVDFGNSAPPQIHGLKWDDRDGDGLRAPGEPGLAGWTIFLDQDGDGQLDPGETATLTNPNGEYLLGGLAVGSYTVAEVLPANWVRTYPPSPGTHAVDVTAGGLADNVDFGNYQNGTVSGLVFNDLDEDGLRDQGEPGLDGWLMFVDVDGDGNRTVGDRWDTTHAGGLFAIVNVPPGTYRLRHARQDGWTPIVPADDYYEITFTSGSTLSDYDFAERELLDFGDAPAPYPTLLADDGPRHRITLYSLGPFPDEERDGQPSASADADDTTGLDDEDGVNFLTALVPGQPAEIRVNAVTNYVTLDAWLDFNRDGDWDDVGERILDHEDLAPFGWQTLSFDVPGWSVPGVTYGRFRVSSDGVDSYTGPADSGEVEDYRVTIANPFNVPLVVPPLEDYGPMNQFGDRNIMLMLDSPRDHATWRFTTKSGGPATFTASADPSSGLRPILALYNGRGDLVAIGGGQPDPADSVLSYTLTPGADEVYTILVQDLDQTHAGQVNMAVDTPTVSSIDPVALDAAGIGSGGGVLITYTIPPLADVDYYELAPIGGLNPDPSNRLAVKVTPLEPYRLEFQLFDGSGNPVGDRVLSPVDGQPAEHVYTGLPGGQSYFVAVFPNRFEDHPAGGMYRLNGVLYSYDCGDAPASYATLIGDNGPLHRIVPNLYLGSGVDNEWEGQPSAAADGDDNAGNDDEDGVVFLEAMSPGHPTGIQVAASAAGMLDAWVDFNADGNFDLGEQVFTSEPLVAGPNDLTARVPIGATVGPTYARFRYSTAGGLSFDGPADDGEVEDYQVTIEPSGEIRGTVFHDENTDGTRGTSEPGLAGWTVFLDEDDDLTLDTNEPYAVTDSGGNYVFGDVPPGSHDVAELGEPGWHQVHPLALPQWVYVAGQVWHPSDLFTPATFLHNNIYIFDQASLELMDVFGHEELDEGLVHDIEIGPGGDVYAAVALGEGHGQIVQFTYEGEYVRTIELPDDALPIPVELPDGRSFFIDYPCPDGFDVLADGSLVVPQPANQQILILDPDGSITATLAVPGFRPVDAGVLSDGSIVFTVDYPQPDPFEYMLNVRSDDAYWVGTSEGAQLRTTDGEVLATRGEGMIPEALETADGTLFAAAVISGGGFQPEERRLVKYDADGNELAHAVIIGPSFGIGPFRQETIVGVTGLAVAGSEVPYGDGPVRGDAGAQGFASTAETTLPPPTRPRNDGRGVWNVVVQPGQVVESVDFGNVEYSTASGVKFNDLDGDGIHDTAEPGLDGWVVWADLDDDGLRDGREPFATTAGGGLFTLEGILPGTYKIREEAQPGWTQTAPAAGYHELQFASGSTVTGLEFGNRQFFHVFVVNSTADPGDGVPDAAELTLREAITAANATANLLEPDRIVFDIPASDPGHVYYRDDGVAGQVSSAQIAATTAADDSLLSDADPEWLHSWFRIRPATDLPWISDPIVIDGYSQSGSRVNTNSVESMRGLSGVQKIELDDGAAPGSALFLDSPAGGSTVRGLVINRSHGLGIVLSKGNGHVIEGNYIGTDPSGTLDLGNGAGLYVGWAGSAGNLIGGLTPAARNLISGNSGDGMRAVTTGNRVQGNLIGTDRSGTRAIRNDSDAVELAANANIVGGTEPGSRNVLSGNGFTGVFITGSNNLVQGNFIGTDVTGRVALGNVTHGVRVASTGNVIGGTDGDDGAVDGIVAASNVISANLQGGISIESASATRVQGNFIGTDVTGTANLGNGFDVSAGRYGGVIVYLATDSLIGGIEPGAGNRIAFNAGEGVLIRSTTGHAILCNAIFANGRLGIDLGINADGVTPNDPGDADTGANNLQNFPVLTSATATASSTSIHGSLNGTPNTALRIELFASEIADESGFGEGQAYLGSTDVTTDSAGDAGFVATFPTSLPPGQFVTATATVLLSGGGFGDTSEYSQAAPVTSAATGEIHGTVWRDANTDGTRGTEEPGLAGWTVFLDSDNDGVPDYDEASTTTDAGGNYAFVGLEAGNYSVAQVLLPNWLQTLPVVVPEWIYVAEWDTEGGMNAIKIFDFDGNLVDAIDLTDLPEAHPGDVHDVEIGPGGDVYVALDVSTFWGGPNEILQLRYDGEFIRAIDLPEDPEVSEQGWSYPYGFDVLSDGRLLVAQPNGQQIVLLDPDGALIQTYALPGVSPQDVAVRGDGEIVYTICDPIVRDMLNVRSDDLYWKGDQTTLVDRGRAVRDLGVSTIDPLEASDGSLYATSDQALRKWDADGNLLWIVLINRHLFQGLAVARNEVPFSPQDLPALFLPAFGAAPEADLRALGASVPAAQTALGSSPGAIPTGRGSWSVVLGAGEVALGVDFGDAELSTASGVKYYDSDGDGTRDEGEARLDGWVIYADLDDDGIRDGREPFATTANGGLYMITGIPPGTYKIREEPQSGWGPTDPPAGYRRIDFLPGSTIEDVDFGNCLSSADFGDAPASYSTLWADDGAWHLIDSNLRLGYQIDAEPDGQPHPSAEGDDLAGDDESGVTVGPLLTGTSASLGVMSSGPGLLSAWVDWNQDGDWADPGEQVLVDEPLEQGSQDVSFAVPEAALVGPTFARFRLSTQAGLSFHGPAPDGEVEDYQVLVQRPVELRGRKWNDLDADGTWDEGEPALPGWTIFLDENGDGQLDELNEASTTTDENGAYAFTGLAPGTYTVVEVQQENWEPTFPLGSIRRVSVDSSGNQGDANSSAPAVGGNFSVVFQSLATNLVPPFGPESVIYGLGSRGDIQPLSFTSEGDRIWEDVFNPSVYGGSVAAESRSGRIVPGDNNGVQDIFVFERLGWEGTPNVERVSVVGSNNWFDEEANGDSLNPSIGGSLEGTQYGRFVAFQSDATNLLGRDEWGFPIDSNGVTDVFVFERGLPFPVLSRVSERWGAQADSPSFDPVISEDGSSVAFTSLAALVADDTNGLFDIFVNGPFGNQIERVSVGRQGNQEIEANGDSQAASISGDGRFVAFWSAATNLVPGDTNGVTDIFVVDRETRSIERVSMGRQGDEEIQADGPSFHPSISREGRFIAFESNATNLAPEGDTNGAPDVFLFDRQTRTIERVSVDGAGNQADRDSHDPSISFDGRKVAFASFATNLVPGDTNAASDVFLYEKYVHTVTLNSGQVAEDLDFGNVYYANSVSGVKYHDLDENGARDPGEPGLDRWIIYVDLNDDGIHDANEPFDTTHDGGLFAIAANVPAGSYKVREVPQPGWTSTQPAAGFYELDFGPEARFGEILFGNRQVLDYGDAPLPYPTLAAADGASHLVQPGFHLGNLVDDEPDGQPSDGADGDDTHAADDEDGVRFLNPLVRGLQAQIEVIASAPGALDAWIDFNVDGDWSDAGERIFTAQPLVFGVNPLSFLVPSFAVLGSPAARFRFSPQGVPSFDGAGPIGEVEDYLVQLYEQDPNVVVNVPAGFADNRLILRRNGNLLQLVNAHNNQLLLNQPLEAIQSLTILGAANKSDLLTVDAGYGGSFVIPGGLLFDGGNGSRPDRLVMLGTAGADALVIRGDQVGVNGILIGLRRLEQVSLEGRAGDDTYEVAALGVPVSVVDGGGSDRLDFSTASAGVTLNLARTSAQRPLPGQSPLTLKGTFETVVGTQFTDRITGSRAADRIWGRGGDDRIYGGGGDDFLYGEAGNDYLFGEGGNNVLLGGEGSDQLTAGPGRNVLIGGLGSDNLKGAQGDDLLIGGTTDYDANDTALRAILAEWGSRRSFAARIDNLLRGGGSNGGYVLRKHETVRDDNLRDALFGGSGNDWFLDFDSDFVADRGSRDR